MSEVSPTFMLPACPRCSAGKRFERPFWQIARNASASRRRKCYFWTGCEHALSLLGSSPTRLFEDAEEVRKLERDWAALRETMIAEKTANMKPEAARAYRFEIDERFALPGATDALSLTPAGPEQQQHEPTKEETDGQ